VNTDVDMKGRCFVSSWSGGKDSCLALWHAVQAGGRPRGLICVLSEEGERTRSHHLPLWLVRCQADALGLPLIVRSASWDDYEREFVSALGEARVLGADVAVFGDLDLDVHREWVTTVCERAGLEACLPIFGRPRSCLLSDLQEAAVRATVIAVTSPLLGARFVGRELTPAFFAEVDRLGADGFGENGEYHTAVTDCALFSSALTLELREPPCDDGPWFAEVLYPVSNARTRKTPPMTAKGSS
jgi:diphthine-ammonia ligase